MCILPKLVMDIFKNNVMSVIQTLAACFGSNQFVGN